MVILSASNKYNGSTTVEGNGVLDLNAGSAAGGGTISLGSGDANGFGKLQIQSTAFTNGGTFESPPLITITGYEGDAEPHLRRKLRAASKDAFCNGRAALRGTRDNRVTEREKLVQPFRHRGESITRASR